MSIVEFKKSIERLQRRERRRRARLANRLAGKLQVLVLLQPMAAREIEKLIDRLLRTS